MKTWFVFDVTNYLGFSNRYGVFAGSAKEGLSLLEENLEYAPKTITCIGDIDHNPDLLGTIDDYYDYRMPAMHTLLCK